MSDLTTAKHARSDAVELIPRAIELLTKKRLDCVTPPDGFRIVHIRGHKPFYHSLRNTAGYRGGGIGGEMGKRDRSVFPKKPSDRSRA